MADRTSVGMPSDLRAPAGAISRRAWLLGALVGSTGMANRVCVAAGTQGTLSPDEKDEIAKVEALARKAGIGPFTRSHTEHFIGLGDAPAPFRQSALEIAESFGKVFLSYFRARGFKTDFPPGRMTVITLKDADSYRALLGEDPGLAVGGHYDVETNRLVMFDFRPQQAELGAGAERVNTFTLVHETAHLLCFNIGILAREADAPACISEGLATFVELWSPKARSTLGGVNRPRLRALRFERNAPEQWIPLADLIKDDRLCDEPSTAQLAYAESWLLVSFVLKKETWRGKFREYLQDLKTQPEGLSGRIKYAESKLGPLEALDRELRKYAREQRKL